jgi:hypothetical protein
MMVVAKANMKISDIITEDIKLRKSAVKSVPGMKTWPDLDNGNVPYLQYRFGIVVAGSPDNIVDSVGPVAGQLTTISYTDVEDEKLDAAARSMGVTPQNRSNKSSKEVDSVNRTSPVAKRKKNKYGV